MDKQEFDLGSNDQRAPTFDLPGGESEVQSTHRSWANAARIPIGKPSAPASDPAPAVAAQPEPKPAEPAVPANPSKGDINRKKWILISTVLAALWILISLLAEDSGIRKSIAAANQGWIDSINSAQVAEHFWEKLTEAKRVDPDPMAAKPTPIYLRPAEAFIYTFQKAADGGPLSLILYLGSIALTWFGLQAWLKSNREQLTWVHVLIALPLGSAALTFALKVIFVFILGIFGTVLQFIGSIAVVILAIEKIRGIFDLAKGTREVAKGIQESVGAFRPK